MAKTYEPIATTTLGSAAASYTFSSINGTYTDIVAVISGVITGSADASLYWRANSDTGTNYSATRVSGNGSAAASYRTSNDTAALTAFIGNTSQSVQIINFMNYANTTTYKTSIARSSYSAQNVGAFVSMWRSTSAITSLTFYSPSGNLDTGMTLTLYGVKAA